MKKIKLLITKTTNITASLHPHTRTYRETYIRTRSKKESEVLACIENKNNATIIVYIHNDVDNTALMELSAKAARNAKSLFQKSQIQLRIVYARGIAKNQKIFLEKGIALVATDVDFYKTDTDVSSLHVVGYQDAKLSMIMEGINLARSLTSQTANFITPDYFAEFCMSDLHKKYGLTVTVHGKEFLEKEKMGCFLGVAQGSSYAPRMIVVEYNPAHIGSKKGSKKTQDAKPIVLVGKGLCYDNGGMYMKPYPYSNDMHGDMAGAATVLGIMRSLQGCAIKKRVLGVIGVTENMVDALSYRNGDVLTARNGKTVLVEHTDAEGRLVLADVLSYVSDTYTPSLIIDYATLTGSCVRSLGEMYTGVMGYNQKHIDRLIKSGNKTNDLLWQLPLDKDCLDSLKKSMADLTNVGSLEMMGASTAAAFLSNFVTDTNNRMHCDIAGTALRSKMKKSFDKKHGVGTGSMVHATLDFLA